LTIFFDRNMHQTSPSSAATPLRTPNRGNGATASWMPLAHTPQQQRQPSQNNSNNTIQETAAVSQNEIPRSISSIIAQAPSATATPLQNGRKYRNVLTKPSNIDQSVMGQPTTLGARLTADQASAMTRGTPALDPQNALQAVVVEQPR
jgi:CCR4-NOT transcriptional regulation complex NOT5 subunit